MSEETSFDGKFVSAYYKRYNDKNIIFEIYFNSPKNPDGIVEFEFWRRQNVIFFNEGDGSIVLNNDLIKEFENLIDIMKKVLSDEE